MRVGAYWRYENGPGALFDCVHAAMDHVAVAMVLNPPEDEPEDIERILTDYLDRAGAKPVAIVEVGFPTSEGVGSSPEEQRRFVELAFQSFDAHADRLAFVSWYEVFDEDRMILQGLADQVYGSAFPEQKRAFVDWLSTLGLQCDEGPKKPAWYAFLDHAATN